MTFKDALTKIPPLRFIYENVQPYSNLGKNELLKLKFDSNLISLSLKFDELEEFIVWYNQVKELPEFAKIVSLLSKILDIFNTIKRLAKFENLDEIELFEIKKSAILLQEIKLLFNQLSFTLLHIEDCEKIIDILDPEKSKVPHFYIYSAYSETLTFLRKQKQAEGTEELNLKIIEEEDKIKKELVEKLSPFAEKLKRNLHHIGQFDLLLTKAQLAEKWSCCKPKINSNKIIYSALFHPIVKSRLEKENKNFQPIDIELQTEPCVITGANMSGKSIFLRTIAFSQWLFQFGFYVPAQSALLVPVEEILFSAGESDSEETGLSSFASEILTINYFLEEAKKPGKRLILIDEFARTTNPTEGAAFVSAFLEIMQKCNAICLVTTHYDNVKTIGRRLRVKGFQNPTNQKITTENINRFIDYQLVETNDNVPPHEAIRIAEILGVNDDFIALAKQNL